MNTLIAYFVTAQLELRFNKFTEMFDYMVKECVIPFREPGEPSSHCSVS